MKLLTVRNIGKAYHSYRNELHRFANWFGISFQPRNEHWVLRHINFSISPGQAIGIIGQNGAGKSTLLKIITGTLRPTEGQVLVNGRIASILELGLGFNPELTGRQNVRHTAAMMGFSADQINNILPEIEAFAEIGNYFDEQVRAYSSGMQMRLAFAVATAYRPEILIVDEALSVGDAYFQHKCFSRIREFREQGTTLLIVSHDNNAILTLCDHAILLEKGHMIKEGKPEEVFDFYNAIIAEKETNTIQVKELDNDRRQTSSGTGEARVEEIFLYNSQDKPVECVGVGENVKLYVKVKVYKPVETLVLGYGIKDRLGRVMYGTNTWHTQQIIHNPNGGDEYIFCIHFSADFGVGSYSVQTALVDRDTHLSANYEWLDFALVFTVVNKDKQEFAGCLWQQPEIKISRCTV
jgi:lipopolysaccharide transport system ATP-binding protein